MSIRLEQSLLMWENSIKNIKKFSKSKYIKHINKYGYEAYISTSYDGSEPALIIINDKIRVTVQIIDSNTVKVLTGDYLLSMEAFIASLIELNGRN